MEKIIDFILGMFIVFLVYLAIFLFGIFLTVDYFGIYSFMSNKFIIIFFIILSIISGILFSKKNTDYALESKSEVEK